MNIPCVKRLTWVVSGLVFVQPALTAIQFDNLTLIATALLMGSGFKVNNPNAVASCGCGSSFRTQEGDSAQGGAGGCSSCH